MQDQDGTPTFTCRSDSPTAAAADARRSALLTVESGLATHGLRDTLTLAGRLETRGIEDCDCCRENRHVLALDLNFVLLARAPVRPGSEHLPEQQFRVPLEQFRSPSHQLNRGYLQRAVEHANDCHDEELRQAVATTTSTRQSDLIAVSLYDLTPHSVEVRWVDVEGANCSVLTFARPARGRP